MRATSYCTLIILLWLYSLPSQGQEQIHSDSLLINVLDANPQYYWENDTLWIISGICKPLKVRMFTGKSVIGMDVPALPKPSIPLVKVHGTIQYDFTYRSFVDTPFSQTHFAQHTFQAGLDFVIRDQYPVRMVLRSRKSNSHYFEDITDLSIQFNKSQFLNQVKGSLTSQIPTVPSRSEIEHWEQKYNQKKGEIGALEKWIQHPSRMQELVEEKENMAVQRITGGVAPPIEDTIIPFRKKVWALTEDMLKSIRDSFQIKGDSQFVRDQQKLDSVIHVTAAEKFREQQLKLENARKEIKNIEMQFAKAKKKLQDSVTLLKKELASLNNPSQIKDFINKHKLDAKNLPAGWKTLGAISTVGIGRSWVDYSELTVKNVSITGINAEMNPSKLYLAFAAGRLNYRFRDFVVKSNDHNKQSLLLMRAGVGRKDGNNFILTWYDGKRNLMQSFGTTPFIGQLERIIGISAESRLSLDANNYVVLEYAKSSYHSAGNTNPDKENLFRKISDFSNRGNEAYSIKINSFLPQSQTRVTGYYRKMGPQFQSFNLYPINVDQEAYQFRVRQSFWKRRIDIDASIRKSDFSSPYLNPGLSSKTVFKSLQAAIRIPKYPMLTIGFYPSSQLTVLSSNVIVENQYNTLNVLMSYSYRLGHLNMSSNANYLRFYNKGADTGFIYYNSSNWMVNQYVFFRKFQLQTGLTISTQQSLLILSLEQAMTWQPTNWLQLNGSIKHHRINSSATLWGNTAGLSVVIPRIGTIRGSYDKSYLPGTSRNMLPVEMGQVSYYRSF